MKPFCHHGHAIRSHRFRRERLPIRRGTRAKPPTTGNRRNAAIWAVSRFAVSNIRCTLRPGAFTFFCAPWRVQCSWFCKEEEKRKKRKHTQTNSCPVRMHWIMVILDRCGSSDRKLRFYAPVSWPKLNWTFFVWFHLRYYHFENVVNNQKKNDNFHLPWTRIG